MIHSKQGNIGSPTILFHNVVHRHFPWFKEKTGDRDSSMSLQYAVPQIGTTESEGEPHFYRFSLTFRGDKPDPWSILYCSIFSF